MTAARRLAADVVGYSRLMNGERDGSGGANIARQHGL